MSKIVLEEPSVPELKIGDKVTYTNPNGVVITGYTVVGFCDWDQENFKGRVFVDSDSPWYPVKKENLRLEDAVDAHRV